MQRKDGPLVKLELNGSRYLICKLVQRLMASGGEVLAAEVGQKNTEIKGSTVHRISLTIINPKLLLHLVCCIS
jgi:hypothetical protein